MKTKLLFLLLFTAIVANSQTRQPFSNIGKKVKVVTLTNGKYDEFFDENPLQRVGSSVINVKTRKITKMEISQAEIDELENAQASRFLSVDPLTREYSWLTPYQYAANSPISGIDLDGLEYRYYMVQFISNIKGETVAIKPTAWRVENEVVHKLETIFGKTIEVKMPRFKETWVAAVGFYNYKFESFDKMQRAVDALKDPEVLAASNECHCLPGADLARTVEAEEKVGKFLQGIGNAAAAGVTLGQGLKTFSNTFADLKRLGRNTRESVDIKLDKYVLNLNHEGAGASKARWFKSALGFTKDNADELAKQIVFDKSKAVKTDLIEQGQKYNQIISITGANGKKIDVKFGFIENKDGVVRMTTAIPPKKR